MLRLRNRQNVPERPYGRIQDAAEAKETSRLMRLGEERQDRRADRNGRLVQTGTLFGDNRSRSP